MTHTVSLCAAALLMGIGATASLAQQSGSRRPVAPPLSYDNFADLTISSAKGGNAEMTAQPFPNYGDTAGGNLH